MRTIATLVVIALPLTIIAVLTWLTCELFSIESMYPVAIVYTAIAVIFLSKEIPKWFVTIPAKPPTIGAAKFFGKPKDYAYEGKVYMPFGKGPVFDFETLSLEPRIFKWEFTDILLDNHDATGESKKEGNEIQRIIVTVDGQVIPSKKNVWNWLDNEQSWEGRLRTIVEQAVREQARDKNKNPHTWQEATKDPKPLVEAALGKLIGKPNEKQVEEARGGSGNIYIPCIFGFLKMLNIKATVPQSILDAETEKEVKRIQMEKDREINQNRVEMVKEMTDAGIAPDAALLDQQVRNKEVTHTVTTARTITDMSKVVAETLEKVGAKGGQVIMVMGGNTPNITETSQKKGGK